VGCASDVQTSATLRLAQVLHRMPNTSFRVIAALILFFESLKNFVRLLMTKSFMSLFFDSMLLIVRYLNK